MGKEGEETRRRGRGHDWWKRDTVLGGVMRWWEVRKYSGKDIGWGKLMEKMHTFDKTFYAQYNS